METIQTKSHVGADGLLHLSLPVDARDADFDVTVILHPTAISQATVTPEAWSRFVAESGGAWQGEPLERAPQGEFEERDKWG